MENQNVNGTNQNILTGDRGGANFSSNLDKDKENVDLLKKEQLNTLEKIKQREGSHGHSEGKFD